MRMRKLLTVLGIVVVVAAGCGKSNDSSKADSSGSGSGKAPVTLTGTVNNHGNADVSGEGSSASLEVETDDFYFGPTFVKAAAGQSISVALHNEGKATHTFTTADGSVDEQLSPDAKKTVTVKVPASGVLVYFCKFHRSQGMQGAVYLHEGDAVGASSSGTPTSTSGGYGY
jgi:plastocyanin